LIFMTYGRAIFGIDDRGMNHFHVNDKYPKARSLPSITRVNHNFFFFY